MKHLTNTLERPLAGKGLVQERDIDKQFGGPPHEFIVVATETRFLDTLNLQFTKARPRWERNLVSVGGITLPK